MASAWSMLWRGEEPQHHERFAVIVFTAQHYLVPISRLSLTANRTKSSCSKLQHERFFAQETGRRGTGHGIAARTRTRDSASQRRDT